MKCPNCGEELKEGYLYCEKCGEEIRIVPDFEPEIENSIIETLSAVAEDVSPEEDQDGILADDMSVETPIVFSKRLIIVLSLLFVLAIAFLAVYFTRPVYKEESVQSKIELAKAAYANSDYTEAANLYDDVLKEQKDSEVIIAYADCLYEMGETDRALSNYYAAIDMDPENEMAYARIIAMYESEEAYEEINALLAGSDSEKIRTEFQNYLAITPVYNYEGGNYNRVIPLKITAPTTGDVYYTLNGTDPMRYGILYTTPIFLRSGVYNVRSIYINDFGICSDYANAQFIIEGTKPREPEISLESGLYTSPQKISVKVPEGCTVYYTTNGTVPDKNSFIYGEPIPMKEGVTNYRFVSISEEDVHSDVVARSYQLNVETEWPAEESISRLKYRLIIKNIILDESGSIEGREGKNIYVYDSLQIIDNKMMHVINEYYQEDNKSRNMTGNVYCVDLSNGYVYKIITDADGKETLDGI
jgi:hypothetical protein